MYFPLLIDIDVLSHYFCLTTVSMNQYVCLSVRKHVRLPLVRLRQTQKYRFEEKNLEKYKKFELHCGISLYIFLPEMSSLSHIYTEQPERK